MLSLNGALVREVTVQNNNLYILPWVKWSNRKTGSSQGYFSVPPLSFPRTVGIFITIIYPVFYNKLYLILWFVWGVFFVFFFSFLDFKFSTIKTFLVQVISKKQKIKTIALYKTTKEEFSIFLFCYNLLNNVYFVWIYIYLYIYAW